MINADRLHLSARIHVLQGDITEGIASFVCIFGTCLMMTVFSLGDFLHADYFRNKNESQLYIS